MNDYDRTEDYEFTDECDEDEEEDCPSIAWLLGALLILAVIVVALGVVL